MHTDAKIADLLYLFSMDHFVAEDNQLIYSQDSQFDRNCQNGPFLLLKYHNDPQLIAHKSLTNEHLRAGKFFIAVISLTFHKQFLCFSQLTQR